MPAIVEGDWMFLRPIASELSPTSLAMAMVDVRSIDLTGDYWWAARALATLLTGRKPAPWTSGVRCHIYTACHLNTLVHTFD